MNVNLEITRQPYQTAQKNTSEDMDLIDILWRQDIDLGIGREMFDTSLRQEQEKEYNKKLNTTEELKKPSDEGQQNATIDNFTLPSIVGAVGGIQTDYRIDNETGEMIPVTPTETTSITDDVLELWQQINILNGNTVLDTSSMQSNDITASIKNESVRNDTLDGFFDEYTTFQPTEQQNTELLSSQIEAAGLGLDDGDLESWQDVLGLLAEQINQTLNNSSAVPQQSQDSGVDLLAELDLLNITPAVPVVENVARNSILFQERSTDNSWNSLDFNLTTNSGQQPVLLNNVSLAANLSTSMPVLSSLLQGNSTIMPSYSGFSRRQPLHVHTQQLDSRRSSTNTSLEQLLSPIFNLSQTSTPTSNITSLFSTLASDSTFTNATFVESTVGSQQNTVNSSLAEPLPALNFSQPVSLAPYANNDTFIQQLLQNDLSDINFDENFDENATSLGGYEGLHEGWSTDSAMSSMHSPSEMYSGASSSGYHDDLASMDGMEELEGATGGSTSSKEEVKYSDMLAYSYSGCEKPQSLRHTNGSANNSSQPQYRPEMLVPSRKHVAHNHTYFLQPGQKSREEKEEEARREREERATRCKDAKRAQMMKIPLTVEEIIDLPVEQFTELLSRFTLTEAQHQLIRDIRRRGKNKAAAQNCRKRKLEVIQTLEDEVEDLRRQRERLMNDKSKMAADTREMKEKFARLQADMLRTLRDASGQQINPEEYTLQRTSDGDIILVPRERTVENMHEEKDARKRKPKRKD